MKAGILGELLDEVINEHSGLIVISQGQVFLKIMLLCLTETNEHQPKQ